MLTLYSETHQDHKNVVPKVVLLFEGLQLLAFSFLQRCHPTL